MAAVTKTKPDVVPVVPLTKSQKRHLDNLRRRDYKRARTTARLEAIAERDAKLKAINDSIQTKINRLQEQRRVELAAVWTDWRKARSESSDA